jgi:hypothetical protein
VGLLLSYLVSGLFHFRSCYLGLDDGWQAPMGKRDAEMRREMCVALCVSVCAFVCIRGREFFGRFGLGDGVWDRKWGKQRLCQRNDRKCTGKEGKGKGLVGLNLEYDYYSHSFLLLASTWYLVFA